MLLACWTDESRIGRSTSVVPRRLIGSDRINSLVLWYISVTHRKSLVGSGSIVSEYVDGCPRPRSCICGVIIPDKFYSRYLAWSLCPGRHVGTLDSEGQPILHSILSHSSCNSILVSYTFLFSPVRRSSMA